MVLWDHQGRMWQKSVALLHYLGRRLEEVFVSSWMRIPCLRTVPGKELVLLTEVVGQTALLGAKIESSC